MRRLAAVVVLLLGLVPPASGAGTSPPKFRTEVIQAPGGGEPSVIWDRTGWTYADAPEGSTVVWRKHGEGAWQPGVGSLGSSGDSDVAVDGDGVLYASDLVDTAGSDPVSVSLNHGASFAYKTVVIPHGGASLVDSQGGLWDRQWLAAWGHGHVVSTSGYFASLLDTTEVEHAWVSRDRGRTYEGPFTIAPPVVGSGKLIHADDGRLYMPYHSPDGIGIAVSTDGRVWRDYVVAAGTTTDGFPGVAVDDAGIVYVTWVAPLANEQASTFGLSLGGVVKVARSTDHGLSWSPPVTVSDPSSTAVFPWIVAGAKGRVAVLYYADRAPVVDAGPDIGTPVTQWDVDIAEGRNDSWTRSVAVAGIHSGSICTEGVGCLSGSQVGLINLPLPFDRRMLDFFGAAVLRDGRVMFVYPADRPFAVGELLFAGVDIHSATQTSGPRLR